MPAQLLLLQQSPVERHTEAQLSSLWEAKQKAGAMYLTSICTNELTLMDRLTSKQSPALDCSVVTNK
jgi:hypothetical protein